MQQLDLLRVFIDPLEKNKIQYFITGSIASIFYGEPRLTHDIDIVVHLTQTDIKSFEKIFSLDEYYCPPEEVLQIENNRRPGGHFNLIHHKTGFKADIYPDADDGLHQWAFENRKHVQLAHNFWLWLAPPEYVVIRKLEYYREGGSDKHISDIKKMLPQINSQLNIHFLEREITARDLQKYWQLCVSRTKS